MEIIKIHNKEAKRVTGYGDIKAEAEALQDFLDETNGHFPGQFNTCFALHHCQVSEEPYSFFVLAKKWVKGKDVEEGTPAKALWPSRVIINPRILEAASMIEREVSTINAVGVKEKLKRMVSNIIRVDEACMSFPHRKEKKMDRFYRIQVQYQIPGILGLRTKKEWIEGIRAHVFQHEFDHDQGRNIAWGDRVK